MTQSIKHAEHILKHTHTHSIRQLPTHLEITRQALARKAFHFPQGKEHLLHSLTPFASLTQVRRGEEPLCSPVCLSTFRRVPGFSGLGSQLRGVAGAQGKEGGLSKQHCHLVAGDSPTSGHGPRDPQWGFFRLLKGTHSVTQQHSFGFHFYCFLSIKVIHVHLINFRKWK